MEPVAPRLLRPGLPRDLETICLKCLAKEPSHRYGSARELAEDLVRFLGGVPILARPAGPVEKVWRWSRHQPALAAAIAGCVIILVGGVSGILWQLRQTKAAQAIAVQKARDEEAQRKAAQQSELVMRQNLYTADMLAVQRALDLNDLGSARLLLNTHRPAAGQTDLRGFEWRYLWARAQGDNCIVLTNAGGRPSALAFSADGRWLAAVGDQVVLYDTATWQVCARSAAPASTVAFVPNSSSLILGRWDSPAVRRWDWRQKGEPSEFIDPHGAWPRVAVSPAGDLISVGCGTDMGGSDPEGSTTLYDAATGQSRRTLPESGGVAAFSPDGRLLATGSWQGKIKLWNPATGELARELTNAFRATAMTFSPDGRTLAVCAPMTDGTWLYDVATGAQRSFARGNFCCVWHAVFSPDGASLATACTDQVVRLWDVKSGGQTALFLGHSFQVNVVAWSPDGQVLASGGSDATVRLWNIATARNTEPSFPGEVRPGMFSSDGKLVAVAESDDVVGIREVASLERAGTPHPIGRPLGFVPDSTTIVSIRWPTNTAGSEVVWWRVSDFAMLQKVALPEVGGQFTRYVISPDRRRLATPGREGEVRVWDLADHGKLLARTFVPDNGYVSELSFSPDGRRLAITFQRSTTGYYWDLQPEHPPSELKGLFGLCIRFSRGGGTFFANGARGLTLWDAASGEEIAPLLGRWGGVNTLDVSPDGKTLAFPARGAIRLWNVTTRREVGRLAIPTGSDRVAFAPDGSALFVMENFPDGPVTVVKRAPSFEQTDRP